LRHGVGLAAYYEVTDEEVRARIRKEQGITPVAATTIYAAFAALAREAAPQARINAL
jgi:hypothetical protein